MTSQDSVEVARKCDSVRQVSLLYVMTFVLFGLTLGICLPPAAQSQDQKQPAPARAAAKRHRLRITEGDITGNFIKGSKSADD